MPGDHYAYVGVEQAAGKGVCPWCSVVPISGLRWSLPTGVAHRTPEGGASVCFSLTPSARSLRNAQAQRVGVPGDELGEQVEGAGGGAEVAGRDA